MLYNGFVNCLKKAETKRIKALSITNSCAPDQIPSAFQLLIPNIVSLMEANIDHLCNNDQIVACFGLQVTSGTIQSNLPRQLNRIHYPLQPDLHLCCILTYLVVEHNTPLLNLNWHSYYSLIIDFTSGYLMDSNHLIYQMLKQDKPGHVYGQLNQMLLKKAWNLTNKERQTINNVFYSKKPIFYLQGESANA